MKRFFLLFPLLYAYTLFSQYSVDDIYRYLESYNELAMKKMYEHKIPASITLAQGIFESACGTSRLATVANNHFGIKCHKEWNGDTILVDDDALQECFRKYEKVEDSYEDHSNFLTSRPRYASLFQIDMMDYAQWAKGLKAAGYATNPKYAERLINLIETYHISKYDSICQQRIQSAYYTNPLPPIETPPSVTKPIVQNPPSSSNIPFFSVDRKKMIPVDYPFSDRKVYKNNKTLFVIANKGDTYKSIANDVQDSEKNMRKYNDSEPGYDPQPNEVVYIELKSKHHSAKQHVVKKSETLRFISQKYGIQLNYIFKYNNLKENSIIHPDDIIKLKY